MPELPSPRRQRYGGLYLLTICLWVVGFLWYLAIGEGRCYPQYSFAAAFLALAGLMMLLDPFDNAERIARGQQPLEDGKDASVRNMSATQLTLFLLALVVGSVNAIGMMYYERLLIRATP